MESVGTITQPPPLSLPALAFESEPEVADTTPQPLRWTREEYQKLYDLGFFQGRRVERIEGVIVTMSPIGPRHKAGVMLADVALRQALGPGYVFSVQNSFAIEDGSDPEPDLFIAQGSIRDYVDVHLTPEVAVLAVEVSDTTLNYDRKTKASLYARAGLADYWLLCVQENRGFLEVRRQPMPDANAPFGWSYAETRIYQKGETVSPLARPDVVIAVSDLLP